MCASYSNRSFYNHCFFVTIFFLSNVKEASPLNPSMNLSVNTLLIIGFAEKLITLRLGIFFSYNPFKVNFKFITLLDVFSNPI